MIVTALTYQAGWEQHEKEAFDYLIYVLRHFNYFIII